jgi:hypothetical protein
MSFVKNLLKFFNLHISISASIVYNWYITICINSNKVGCRILMFFLLFNFFSTYLFVKISFNVYSIASLFLELDFHTCSIICIPKFYMLKHSYNIIVNYRMTFKRKFVCQNLVISCLITINVNCFCK